MLVNDEHFFRHEYANLVALLTRKMGVQHLELVEDAVQSSLVKALDTWKTQTPSNPSAWLYRVAYNALIDELRKRQRIDFVDEINDIHDTEISLSNDHHDRSTLDDDFLHMLFVCCDEAIPEQYRLIISLKVLCGFNTKEIAQRLFLSEANVYKSYQRARDVLRSQSAHFNLLPIEKSIQGLNSVLRVLYLLFTEGSLSNSPDYSIRIDLCQEAIRLLTLLSIKSVGDDPKVMALLALMSFNFARINARQSDSGSLLLLEEQDRSRWDLSYISRGFEYLAQSSQGESLSCYHLEAAISAEHCRSDTFEGTDWEKIYLYYQQLEMLVPSYYYRLNRALALAEWQTPQAGLTLLSNLEPPTWMSRSYMWLAVSADLHARCGLSKKAHELTQLALKCTPNENINTLISRRLSKPSEK